MELKKLAIALLALYIVYCFMSKENYAFDEPGLQFPADAGYIDIYHKKGKVYDRKGKEMNVILIDKVTYSANIAPENNGKTKVDNSVATITKFTSKIPKSILGYGVYYETSSKTVESYRPMTFINATNIQVLMKPGKEIILENLTTGNLGSQNTFPAFNDGESIHTGRFVFTF